MPAQTVVHDQRRRAVGQRAGSAAPHLAGKSKAVVLPLCIFSGALGVHRYYVGKIGTGVIWTLTARFFGIGWIVDIFTVASAAS